MSAFEQITARIQLLADAMRRCINNGHLSMAFMWRLKMAQLERKRDAMTVEEAVVVV